MTDATTDQETAEHDAATAWLDDLEPAATPARVVPQEVRDVADVVDRVRAVEKELEDSVLGARRAGASWNDLALALGVSRQAARQRFARLERESAAT